MATEDVAKVSTEQKEVLAKQPDESLAGERVVASTEATSDQGAGSDRGNQSEGCSDNDIASNNHECVKIGAEGALAA
jgi:hypothetical protein